MSARISKFSWLMSLLPLIYLYSRQDRSLLMLIKDLAFNEPWKCETQPYEARILCFDPLLIHIEHFITVRERQSILKHGAGNLQRSEIQLPNGTSGVTDYRTSSTASILRDVPGVACLRDRFLSFQGYRSDSDLETIQVTHYEKGQQFKPHLDNLAPFETNKTERFLRTTTGFGILESNCENCGTQFPFIPTNWSKASKEWCRIVECEQEVLTVKPLPGSVLFWQNIGSDGEVDTRMTHAGLPLTGPGVKTGINLWTNIDLWENSIDHRH